MPERVLLCRPHGGLNDTLCRISVCWRYAERFGRHLVIDTRRSSLAAPFDRHFTLAHRTAEVSCSLTPDLRERLDSMRCRPSCLEGRIDGVRAISAAGSPNMVDSVTRQPLQFAEASTAAFERDHDEPLLVYEGHGGGTSSADLLPHLRLAPEVLERVRVAMKPLESPYSAVHVRNTDLRTDWRRLLREVGRVHRSGPLLLCSDDPRVISRARAALDVPVLSFQGRPQSIDPTGTLHHRHSHATADAWLQAAREAIVDLIALGNAQRIYCGLTTAGRISGFSFLASHLCSNPGTLDALLGVPPQQRRPSDPDAAVTLDVSGGWRHRIQSLLGFLRR